MNIGMLLNAPYPADMRVRKEAIALLKAGYNVHLLCLRRHGESGFDAVDGIRVTRIYAGTNDVQLAFWDVIMSATFVHPKFSRASRKWILKHDIKVLHVHDLPLVGTALSLKKSLGITVLADFHENYPEALKAWFEWKRNPIARLKNELFMNPSRWTVHEAEAVGRSDHVIAVVEEMKNRLVGQYHVSPGKITVVTNTEELDFTRQEEDPQVYDTVGNQFVITYSGNIGPHRGVDTVIEAMQYLRDYPIILVVIGSGRNVVMQTLKELTRKLNVSTKVHFLGRQPFSKFYSYMKFADINVIPHKSNGHTDNTVPHKLFQAMMAGKPVLVSSSPPLRRIISQTDAGLVFEAGNSKDCSDKVFSLYSDEKLRKQLGHNGFRHTRDGDMNWESTQRTLVELYRSLFRMLAADS